MPSLMLERLLDGGIDWIETDHAPHTRRDKIEFHACGLPGLPFYPRFIRLLTGRGVPRGRIDEITHDAICGAFSLAIENRRRDGDQDLAGEYEFDPFAMVKNGATADQ